MAIHPQLNPRWRYQIRSQMKFALLFAVLSLPAQQAKYPTLVVTAPVRPLHLQYVGLQLFKAPDGTYTPAGFAFDRDVKAISIYRNGIRMVLGTDYTLKAKFVVKPTTPWDDTDSVIADVYR